MDRSYNPPPIVWLKMTDYMHAWLQYELGGGARIKSQKVVCVQDIPGARDVLMMETDEDTMEPRKVTNAMSGTRKNCVCLGLELDPAVVEELYGLTEKQMALFVPVECPRRCLTKNGVLRPWTLDVCFGRDQATAMQRLLKQEFWNAVDRHNLDYARKMKGEKYPAVDMIESFCRLTGTPDLYVDAIRREWQRRVKRGETTTPPKYVEKVVTILDKPK